MILLQPKAPGEGPVSEWARRILAEHAASPRIYCAACYIAQRQQGARPC